MAKKHFFSIQTSHNGVFADYPLTQYQSLQWCMGFMYRHLNAYPCDPIRVIRDDGKIVGESAGNGNVHVNSEKDETVFIVEVRWQQSETDYHCEIMGVCKSRESALKLIQKEKAIEYVDQPALIWKNKVWVAIWEEPFDGGMPKNCYFYDLKGNVVEDLNVL